MIQRQNEYTAGVYCRLSSDDGQASGSTSIETQKILLEQYCKEHKFSIGDYYCDDGWSGTNFERPEFKRMISDIDKGKLNLVIVKDLSRFGREYAQMGMYIEHYFEENDVRFIAVGENIDTINGTDNVLMPITNVINSLYAKDCSKKTKAAHRALAKSGKYIGGRPPFGYLKDPKDRHKLIIDEPAAETVWLVFKLFSEGIGYVRMTKILREKKILNPQAYFNQNNPDYYKSDYWRKPFDWHATSIRSLLKNPVYLGHVVFGRSKVKGIYDKRKVPVPQDDWILVENMHEPIIDQNTWDVVHQLMKNRRRESRRGEIQMFAGLVKCADCGSSLNLSYDAKKQKHKNFSCWVYKNYGKNRCTSHAIGWKTMNTLVLNDIRANAAAAILNVEHYEQMLMQAQNQKQNEEIRKLKRESKKLGKRIAELDTILNKLYEDYALSKIPENRYLSLSTTYESERKEKSEQLDEYQTALDQASEAMVNTKSFLKIIRQCIDIQELNAKILNELIEKIVVHEKTVNPDGSKSQRVDIYYKFIGYLPLEQMILSADNIISSASPAECTKALQQTSA